jgi:hypothetical protein
MIISKKNIKYLINITGRPVGFTCQAGGKISYFESLSEAREYAGNRPKGILTTYGLTDGVHMVKHFGSVMS